MKYEHTLQATFRERDWLIHSERFVSCRGTLARITVRREERFADPAPATDIRHRIDLAGVAQGETTLKVLQIFGAWFDSTNQLLYDRSSRQGWDRAIHQIMELAVPQEVNRYLPTEDEGVFVLNEAFYDTPLPVVFDATKKEKAKLREIITTQEQEPWTPKEQSDNLNNLNQTNL